MSMHKSDTDELTAGAVLRYAKNHSSPPLQQLKAVKARFASSALKHNRENLADTIKHSVSPPYNENIGTGEDLHPDVSRLRDDYITELGNKGVPEHLAIKQFEHDVASITGALDKLGSDPSARIVATADEDQRKTFRTANFTFEELERGQQFLRKLAGKTRDKTVTDAIDTVNGAVQQRLDVLSR